MDSTGATIGATNPLSVTSEGADPLTHTFAQLTAPGSTTGFATPGRNNHSMFVTIANISTNVVIRIEGSADNTAWANLDGAELDTTYTANGTRILTAPETPLAYIRVTMVSGGAGVTVDARYVGH